ncbi:MAG: PilZ domain-containing protein [Lachnospiraceae bacterium]|nr:PilZ domain-containing protein [Lachnospiraceae bacterium]
MEIRELDPSFKMSITISNQQSQMTLNSEIAFVSGDKLYVTPFEHNGVILNFNTGAVVISMIAYQEEKTPFLWKIVHINRETVDGVNYHVITSDVSGVKINRRENFRVFIGIDGKATILGKDVPFDVMIKDVSESGFAILVDITSQVKINKNEAVMIDFYDKTIDERFNLTGRVVRAEMTERYVLYGCRLLKDTGIMRKYIANKQLANRVNSNRKKI